MALHSLQAVRQGAEEQEIIKEKIKVANHRIDDLERVEGKG